MLFGTVLKEASYQENMLKKAWSLEVARRDLDLISLLDVNFVRIDIFYEMFQPEQVDPRWLNALDEVVRLIRLKNMKLMVGVFGHAHSYAALWEPHGKLTPQEWETIEKSMIRESIRRWSPEYIYIAPEAPTLMSRQITSPLTAKEWRDLIERLANVAKEENPNVITSLGLSCGWPDSLELWLELAKSKVLSLDIVGYNPYGISSVKTMDRLQGSVNSTFDALKAKYELWITETSLWGFLFPFPSDFDGYRDYRSYMTKSIAYAEQKGMGGYIWFYFKKDPEWWGGGAHGLVSEKWTLRPHYFTYMNIVKGVPIPIVEGLPRGWWLLETTAILSPLLFVGAVLIGQEVGKLVT